MIAVPAHGKEVCRLVNAAGRDVGWIQPRIIGFGGFATRDGARAAALRGARALATCLKQEFGVGHLELSDRPRVRIVRDGADEWVVDGPLCVARLIPVEPARGHDPEFVIEFRLPPHATDALAIKAARIVYGAMGAGRSGPLDLHAVAAPERVAR